MPNQPTGSWTPEEAGVDLVLEAVDHVHDEVTKLRSTVDHYCPADRRARVMVAVEVADLGLTEVKLRVQRP